MNFAPLDAMKNQLNELDSLKMTSYAGRLKKPDKVWQHSFSLEETVGNGFQVSYKRSFGFYLTVFFAIVLALPLIFTTGLSIQAMLFDPFEAFMMFFSFGLNVLRIFALKVLYDYVRDAWRMVTFTSFDEMFSIENRIFRWANHNQAFHLSDVSGLEIRALQLVALVPAGADDGDEQACEIILKLHNGGDVILIPRVESVQNARTLVYQISNLTGLRLLTDIGSLYRHLNQI